MHKWRGDSAQVGLTPRAAAQTTAQPVMWAVSMWGSCWGKKREKSRGTKKNQRKAGGLSCLKPGPTCSVFPEPQATCILPTGSLFPELSLLPQPLGCETKGALLRKVHTAFWPWHPFCGVPQNGYQMSIMKLPTSIIKQGLSCKRQLTWGRSG